MNDCKTDGSPWSHLHWKEIVLLLAVVALGVGGVWRLRLATDVESRLQTIRSAGLPTSGAELNKYYAAVPDAENAALVMTQAFALMRSYPDARANELLRFITPRHGTVLTGEEKQLLVGYVEMNTATLAKAREACMLPKHRYPVDFTHGATALLPHLGKLKELARAASFQALLAADSGQSAQATAAIEDVLKMGETLDEEPCLASQLVHVAILRMSASALERCLNSGAPSAAELTRLAQIFASAGSTDLIVRGLVGDRAIYIPVFRMSYAEMERLAKDGENSADSPRAPLPGPQPMVYRVTGFFERDLRYYLQTMEKGISLANQSPPACLAAITNFENARAEGKEHWYTFSSMFLPALSRAVQKEVGAVAAVRLATTALAIEQFRLARGKLPEALNELTPQFLPSVPADPFDGKPLRYRRLAKGYMIYSIDRDLHDDGGRERPERVKSTDTNTYDMTFIVER